MPSSGSADDLSDTLETSNAQTEDLDLKKPRNWLTVNWIREHFEDAEGVNISRGSIYDCYLDYAIQVQIEAVNTASFGKLMRTLFPQLSTRRLGVRGQSRYHYNGIQVRPTSALLDKIEVHEKTGQGSKRVIRDALSNFMTHLDVMLPMQPNGDPDSQVKSAQQQNMIGQQLHGSMSPLYSPFPTPTLPDLPVISEAHFPPGLPPKKWSQLVNAYYQHCQEILTIVSTGDFTGVERVVCVFWVQTVKKNYSQLIDIPMVTEWIAECDIILYSTIALMLVPDILRHIPMDRMQLMRTFARNLQGWLAHYLHPLYSANFVKRKLIVSKSFLETLKKSTVVNHVTEAARSALINEARVTDMSNELCRLDFDAFKADLLWATQYPEEPVRRAFMSIKELLMHKAPVEMWANWMELLLGQCVRSMQAALTLELGGNQDILFLQRLPTTMRHTVVRWSYFADIILRELSLRSSPVFGSFHLLRLFMNEYLSLIAEKMVAHVRLAFYQERTSEQVWRAIHPLMVFYLEVNDYFPPSYADQQQQQHPQQPIANPMPFDHFGSHNHNPINPPLVPFPYHHPNHVNANTANAATASPANAVGAGKMPTGDTVLENFASPTFFGANVEALHPYSHSPDDQQPEQPQQPQPQQKPRPQKQPTSPPSSMDPTTIYPMATSGIYGQTGMHPSMVTIAAEEQEQQHQEPIPPIPTGKKIRMDSSLAHILDLKKENAA